MFEARKAAREQQRKLEQQASERARARALELEQQRAHRAAAEAEADRNRQLRENQRLYEEQRAALETELTQYRKKIPARQTPLDDAVTFWVKELKYADEHLWLPGPDPRPVIRPGLIKAARKLVRPGEQIIGLGSNHVDLSSRPVDVMSGRPRTYHSIFVFVTDQGFLVVPPRGAPYRVERDEVVAIVDLGSVEEGPRGPWLHLRLPGDQLWTRDMLLAVWLQQRMAKDKASAPKHVPARKQPRAQQILDFNDAERVAAEWMSYFGYSNVGVMPIGPDGGVDVYSEEALAQVKATTSPSTRPQIQQHLGVCTPRSKLPLFFSMAGYTPGAVEWADRNGMALFSFNRTGGVTAANTLAQTIMEKAETS
ncbi:MAG: restriction endonuclease [Frankiales bacterium]|nr:restriction endonuclease [Frankiales bacterium]